MSDWIDVKERRPLLLAQYLVFIQKPMFGLAYYDVLTFLPQHGLFDDQEPWITHWQPIVAPNSKEEL